jgi:hypothetical protein
MPDRFVHVHIPPDQDPLALTSALVRWLEESYRGSLSTQEAAEEDIEVVIRIRYDAVGANRGAEETLTA